MVVSSSNSKLAVLVWNNNEMFNKKESWGEKDVTHLKLAVPHYCTFEKYSVFMCPVRTNNKFGTFK